jgi:hypothetical protein
LQAQAFMPPQEVEDLRSVVIYDDFHTPIIIVQKMDEGQIITYRAGDSNFAKALNALGIGLNAKCEELRG